MHIELPGTVLKGHTLESLSVGAEVRSTGLIVADELIERRPKVDLYFDEHVALLHQEPNAYRRQMKALRWRTMSCAVLILP